MVIIETVFNTLVGRLTLDPAGMHCPSWDDAFVSSLLLFCDYEGRLTVAATPGPYLRGFPVSTAPSRKFLT